TFHYNRTLIMASTAKEIFDAAADVFAVYMPIIGAVKTLNQIDEKLDGIAQGIDVMKSEMTKKGDFFAEKIDSSELGDLETPVHRGKVFKRIYKSIIEVASWCHQPELRITIPALRPKLEALAKKYPISFGTPQLFDNKALDLDGQKTEPLPVFEENIEIEDEVPEEVAVVPFATKY
ncbi:2461_t:CDS:2, partial [Racocetra persica]